MMTKNIDELGKTEIDPATLEAKPFVVIVGGWRPVGRYATQEEAQAKASTCISALVEIIEMKKVSE